MAWKVWCGRRASTRRTQEAASSTSGELARVPPNHILPLFAFDRSAHKDESVEMPYFYSLGRIFSRFAG